ncbi:MAG: FKBP-type peptidyl-prolyl cis-trans isomerase [Lachnospiraceae bacterium]|nr:FKBP-type peptidyl-prolyl cis-trans isomerase [Lachnospiraceae bacterium]
MSSAKRELQRQNREKAIRKQKTKKVLTIGICSALGLAFVAGIIYWIVYANFILTKPVEDYSKGLTDDGKIEGVTLSDYITLGDYQNIAFNYTDEVMTYEEAMAQLEQEAGNSGDLSTETDIDIQLGDKINLDYTGKIDGVAFENGSTNGAGTDIVVGSAGYIDDFEDQLVGHSPGDEFEIQVTFPADYGQADLASKEAVFEIKINGIYEKSEINDDYIIENHGDVASSVEEYCDYLIKLDFDEKIKTYGLDKAVENSTLIQYPDKYVKTQMGIQKHSDEETFNYYLSFGFDMKWKDFIGMSESEYEAELRLSAEDDVKKKMVVQAIFEQEGFVVTDEDINAVLVDLGSSDVYMTQMIETYGKGYLYQQAMYKIVETYLSERVYIEY